MKNSIFTFEKLYKAYLDCRRTKRKTINALRFEWNLEENLFQIQEELETGKYKPGPSVCFVVESPSPREIFAASFKDRVIHHFLIREVLHMGEKEFIFDSFACRKNKGTHAGIKRLKKFIRQIGQNNQHSDCSYAQLDVSSFFMNIDHDILFSIFKKLISKQNKSDQWKKEVLWLGKIIIFHKPTKNYIIKGDSKSFDLISPQKSLFRSKKNTGLPIGNYSSQFFANLYLNKLDQFVKRRLKCKYYVRYTDDFVLLDKEKEKLKFWENKINEFLKENLNLKLNPKKTKIQSINKGTNFLGYFIKPNHVLVRKKVVNRLKNKLHKINQLESDYFLEKILAMINSYYGHFKHADSFNLRKDIYKNHLGKLNKVLVVNNNYFTLEIKK